MQQAWADDYRSNTIDEYVFTNEKQRELITHWIKQGSIPHCLFSGSSGTGKSTLAKLLIKELKVDEFDVLEANGSKEARKVEWIDTLINFCSTMPFGDFKIVFIDEADYMNIHSVQPALRNLMEDYNRTVRFILTCNLPARIMPAIHSRCEQGRMHIEKLDKNEFTARVATVLVTENIEFDLDTLDTYIKVTYPDLRKCINFVQQNTQDGKLLGANKSDAGQADYKIQMVELFKQGKIQAARKLLCGSARPEEMEGIYRWCYDNLDLFGKDEESKDSALLVIKQGLCDHTIIADPEINLSAVMVKLARLQ
jgi:DNA polymerase III delta prime subunit